MLAGHRRCATHMCGLRYCDIEHLRAGHVNSKAQNRLRISKPWSMIDGCLKSRGHLGVQSSIRLRNVKLPHRKWTRSRCEVEDTSGESESAHSHCRFVMLKYGWVWKLRCSLKKYKKKRRSKTPEEKRGTFYCYMSDEFSGVTGGKF